MEGIAYLHDEPSTLMACKRPVLEGLVDAEQRRIKIGVDERRCDVLREDQRRRWGPRELRDLRGTLPVKAPSESRKDVTRTVEGTTIKRMKVKGQDILVEEESRRKQRGSKERTRGNVGADDEG